MRVELHFGAAQRRGLLPRELAMWVILRIPLRFVKL
jgi:hypothetical protein